MTSQGMSSVERVNAFLNRRDQDRIPRSDGFWPETLERWKNEGMADGQLEALLQRDIEHAAWIWPVPYPGRLEVVEEDDQTRVVVDRMGNTQRWWKHRSGTQEHIAFGFVDEASWHETYRPALLEQGLAWDQDQVSRQHREARRRGRWVSYGGIESFEAMRQLVGDECLLMAMLAEPDWVRDMSKVYTDLIIQHFEMMWDAGVTVDGVWLYGDVGYNPQPFFSPATYRDTIWEDHRRLADWAHRRGLKFIYHTDGNVQPLIPLFLEAGFDAIQPMEAKAGMDVRKLAPTFGDRLSFFGNIDMTVAITNDPARVEAEVIAKLQAGMQRRGYAYHSDHSVPPQVSWATYQLILKLVDQHGRYDSGSHV